MAGSASYPDLEEYLKKVRLRPHLSGGSRPLALVPEDRITPLVSIITVTLNAEKTLGRSLESVASQTYSNIEHIVVDGGSSDGTLDIIRAKRETIAYWRSEPDEGIYDAFNKGVALATGEFVGILNADDYFEPDQIEKAVEALARSDAPFVHGDIVLHGWRGNDVYISGDPHYESRIRERMPSLHQVTALCRRSVYRKHGLFSTRYKIAGDFDWYLRLAKAGCIGKYVPGICAHMTAGGVSTTQQRRAFREALLITWRHGLPLHRAVRITLPRICLPNGTPLIWGRLVRSIRHPISTLRRVAGRVGSGRDVLVPTTSKNVGVSVLDAFVGARQLSLDVDPIGLEWIYGVGLRASTYTMLSNDRRGRTAQVLLEGAGMRIVETLEDAAVWIVDEDQAGRLDLAHSLENKTLLVTFDSREKIDQWARFPFLDFGGIIGLGQLVNPLINLRAPA